MFLIAPYVKQDPKFLRPAEVDELVADPSKARDVLGWNPAVSFEELVAMMVTAEESSFDDAGR